jgi:LytS/YehU family sensor histidine kinase
VYNALLALILLPVWYPININKWDNKKWDFYAVAHLFLSFTIITVWMFVSGLIMWAIAGDNDNYLRSMQVRNGGRFIQGIIFYLITVLTYYLYIYINRVKEKQANEIRLNRLIKDNELNLLKSQINPHFLFNSLNSLNSLIIKNVEQSQKMLIALSDYLRYTVLSSNNPYFSLQQEIENIERYLAIEQLRFGNKLEYKFDISADCSAVKVPSMLLQPLFENAVKHGVYESLQTVRIDATAAINNGALVITIANNYDTEHLVQKKGSGTGLKNIRERLRLSYGNAAGLQSKIEGGKFVATLRIPV